MMLDVSGTWMEVQNFQNPELRNPKLTTYNNFILPMKY